MSANEDVSEDEKKANVTEGLKLLGRTKSGAIWFFWIAGLSIINAIVLLAGGSWGFLIGLGTTQLVVEIFGPGNWIALIFVIIAAGVYVLFGFMGLRRKTWSFVVGVVLYSLDGLLFLMIGDWLSVGFHAFALIFIVLGLVACVRLNKLDPTKDISDIDKNK